LKELMARDEDEFELAISKRNEKGNYLLRLFVTGSTPRSVRAIQNIRAICNQELAGRYELEVIDLYRHPEQAKPEQIVVAPTLMKMFPLPVRRLVGDLSNLRSVLAGLDIVPRAGEIPEPGNGA
jgi:circadian clock protein KaiB